jgi:hypothetical protein
MAHTIFIFLVLPTHDSRQLKDDIHQLLLDTNTMIQNLRTVARLNSRNTMLQLFRLQDTLASVFPWSESFVISSIRSPHNILMAQVKAVLCACQHKLAPANSLFFDENDCVSLLKAKLRFNS